MKHIAILATLFLVGCATVQDPESMSGFYDQVSVASDQHSGITTIEGYRYSDIQIFDEDANWRMRSFVSHGQVLHQAFVTVSYKSDWAFYYRAASNGIPLEFTEIDRSVISCQTNPCRLFEAFGAEIPQELIATGSQSGLVVRFYARDGYTRDATFPAEYIQAQLAAVADLTE